MSFHRFFLALPSSAVLALSLGLAFPWSNALANEDDIFQSLRTHADGRNHLLQIAQAHGGDRARIAAELAAMGMTCGRTPGDIEQSSYRCVLIICYGGMFGGNKSIGYNFYPPRPTDEKFAERLYTAGIAFYPVVPFGFCDSQEERYQRQIDQFEGMILIEDQ